MDIIAQDMALLARRQAQVAAPRNHRLRRARLALKRLQQGQAAQLGIACIGTSWTQTPGRWTRVFASTLQAPYGNVGSGFCSCSYPAAGLSYLFAGARSDLYTAVQSGSGWTSSHYGQSTPSMGRASSSIAGDKYTWTGPAGHSSTTCHYSANAGSSVRYRWDGGAWTTRALDTGRSFALTGTPAAAFTLEIEVVGGTVRLAGVEFRKSGNGVRVHNLGSSGSTTSQWTSMSSTNWQAAVADLGAVAFIVELGINDKFSDRPPTAMAADLQVLISRLRAAVPVCDILLLCPPETPTAQARPDVHPMTAYAAEILRLADANDCDFLDLQGVFGVNVADYAAGTTLDLIDPDGTHPNETQGAYAIAAAVLDRFQVM